METLIMRFVTYPEDGLWVAHSLELDIIGVGETPVAAIQELKSNSEAHLSFSKFKKISPFREAPEWVTKLWNEINLDTLGLQPKSDKGAPKAGQRSKSPAKRASADVLQWTKRELSKLPAKFDLQCA